MKPLATGIVAFAVIAAAIHPACAQQSPSEEFEAKMAPYKRQEFLLPAAAGVRLINVGKREPVEKLDETSRLIQEQKRQRDDEVRWNNTWSTPDLVRPAPRTLNCNGSTCYER